MICKLESKMKKTTSSIHYFTNIFYNIYKDTQYIVNIILGSLKRLFTFVHIPYRVFGKVFTPINHVKSDVPLE